MSTTKLQGHWDQITGKVKERWGQISEDELMEFEGDVDQLVGFIELRTTDARETIAEYVDRVIKDCEGPLERIQRETGEYAQRSGEFVAHAYDQVRDGMRQGVEQAAEQVQRRPGSSIGVAFGAGLVAGALVALTLRSR